MIADRNMMSEKVLEFLVNVSDDLLLDGALAELEISLDAYARKLAEKGTIAYELEDGRLVCGVIGYTHDTPDQGSYITQVATLKSHRRRGIAQRLLVEYLDYARHEGICYVWLTTGMEDTADQRLYEKCGFQKLGRVVNQLTGTELYRYEKHFEEKL